MPSSGRCGSNDRHVVVRSVGWTSYGCASCRLSLAGPMESKKVVHRLFCLHHHPWGDQPADYFLTIATSRIKPKSFKESAIVDGLQWAERHLKIQIDDKRSKKDKNK